MSIFGLSIINNPDSLILLTFRYAQQNILKDFSLSENSNDASLTIPIFALLEIPRKIVTALHPVSSLAFSNTLSKSIAFGSS